ncbi:MAG: flagellin [Planctomycetes bacterium]|nr:flagellin [Planctomycetota bacterium]
MGLRINSNAGALGALRAIQQNTLGLARPLERLATGLQINRAADNPAGLVLSQLLLAQLSGTQQAIENTQLDANVLNVAEAGAAEISDRLVSLRADVIAGLNTAVAGPEVQAALQQSIDSNVQAIQRIADTTRFTSTGLLNGQAGFTVTGAGAPIADVRVSGANLAGGPLDVDAVVTAAATQATAGGTLNAGGQVGAATIRIQGELGAADLTLAGGETQAQVISAINALSAQTGVQATAGGVVESTDVGSASRVSITNITGSLTGITEGTTFGTDIQGTLAGQQAGGDRNTLTTTGPTFTGAVEFSAGTGPGTTTFTVAGGGLGFQVGPSANSDFLRVGIEGLQPSNIGGTGGSTLSSIVSGGANALTSNPQQALSIIDRAITDVAGIRAQIGSTISNVLEPQANSLAVAAENLLAATSTIRDANFAEQVSEQSRRQILLQGSIFALRQNNLSQGSVLRLLGPQAG